jgi:leucyl/phenylalanyl-tRNA--protein transferase
VWAFPSPDQADEAGVVAVGGDLEPGTLLTAYRCGLFPMPLGRRGDVGWWSPDPRGVLPLPGLRVSRSLRRSARRFEIRVDTAFEQVIAACADPRRPDGWITGDVLSAYVRLHELGWAHSVEAWDGDDGDLVGGLYGVAIGGLFAGESMFHRRTDASKVALLGLVELLAEGGGLGRVLDVQWVTPHLASLGAEEVPRWRYLEMVRRAVKLPLPPAFRPPPPS